MKEKFMLLFMSVLMLVMPSFASENFKLVERWDHGENIFGRISKSMLDKDGQLVVGFRRNGLRLITPEKITAFAPFGEGKGDLMNYLALIPFKGDVAFVERPEKVKIFTHKNHTYVEKEILWFKRGKYPHQITNGVFVDNKWFFAGLAYLNYDPKIFKVCYIKAYNKDRNPLKNLIKDEYKEKNQHHLMDFYLVYFKDRLFFLAENELKVSIISIKELEILKEVKLSVPGFYKPMPGDFYGFRQYNYNARKLIADIEYWITSYSRIEKALVEDNYLVLQVRTCSDEMKNYALLFYNVDNFKLEKTIFTDDYLLGSKDGKYYFYANGNPSLDDDTDNCIIDIYQFKK